MKKVLKSLALASAVMFVFACKSDPSASSNTAAASMSSAMPSTSPTQAATASAVAATATEAAPTAKAAESVTPSANQVSPAPANPVSQSNGKSTTIKFDEMSYDWGKLKEGEKMTHIFKFKNTGNNDLIISDARGSCGCTVPEWPKEPIKAGKGGEIKVIFDSAHKNGPQSKTVTLTANTDPTNVVLMIKGNVDPKEEEKTN
jgi:Protein of unknown function (DUF1573)